LTDADYQAAQAAIAEAEAVQADQYAPDLLNKARNELSQARAQGASDPDAARKLLASSVDDAHAARDAAQKARTQALIDKLDRAAAEWKALQPDRWIPDEAAPVTAHEEAARAAVLADYDKGLPLANASLSEMADAKAKLSARLLAVQDVRLKAQGALDDADKADASIWVPDLVQGANDAFFQGTGAWKGYRLDAAEEAWSTALFQAQSAAAKAKTAAERKRTEQLMLDTMKKLEGASTKTIVDPQDNIIGPQPWNGTQELQKLQQKPLSIIIPETGTVVMGDKQRVTYLDEAKAQWAQGVKAYNDGDLTLANESFLQAQKLIDTYLAMAVDKIYTVRLIPDRRDSLWRIAEYKDIFGTPWDWPKIWKRNQKLIQNPDLIYPGWQLIIPPQ
jgi:nucleoid-associated protein YgaU